MTGSVSSHTWILAAVYLAAGIIGAVALRAVLARLHRKAGQARWRGGTVVAFLRLGGGLGPAVAQRLPL